MTAQLVEHPSATQPPPVPEDDDALRDEITTLAGHLAAATCRLLVLIGEFDARDAWGGAGILSTAHWLSLRCGIAAGTAREHVRVARALRTLPRTTEAFAQGRLSYSKVRAITRVATPETEQDLVDLALVAPANHVERLVRGLAVAQNLDDVRRQQARRGLRWWWADDGSLRLTGIFTPEDGAVVVDALQAYAERMEDDLDGAGPLPEEEADGDDPAPRRRRTAADALVEICGAVHPEADDASRWAHARESVVHVDVRDLATPPDRAADDRGTPTGPTLAGGHALHRETARRLACDGGIVVEVDGPRGEPLALGRRTRRPSAALMRALWRRDGGCRYPGCGRRRYLHAHHVVFWARGGPTTADNLVLLCGGHHRLLHEGEFTLELSGDGTVLVRGPDGAVVRPAPRSSGHLPTLLDATATLAPGIGPETVGGRWGGEPLDVRYATSVLMENWSHREERSILDGEDRSTRDGP